MSLKTILLIILVIVILLVVAYFLINFGLLYYIASYKSPTQMLFEAMEKSSKLEKVRVNYSGSVSLSMGSLTASGEALSTTIKFGDRYKNIVTISTPSLYGGPASTSTRETYTLPEGKVECEKVSIITSEYSCEEIEEPETPLESQTISVQEQIEQLKDLIENGMVEVSYLGKKKIINRNCDNLKFDVNVSKLMKNITGSMTFREGEANYTLEMCFDEEHGIVLETILKFWVKNIMGNEVNIEMDLKATHIDFDVSRSDVELPVPLSEVRWLSELSIESSTCRAGSNIVTVKVKARKDVPSGQAVLNLTWTDYDIYSGYKTYSLISSTSFPGAKRGETKELRFNLPSPLNESESYTLKVKVDSSESDTGYCNTYSWTLSSLTGYFTQIIEKFRNITKIV